MTDSAGAALWTIAADCVDKPFAVSSRWRRSAVSVSCRGADERLPGLLVGPQPHGRIHRILGPNQHHQVGVLGRAVLGFQCAVDTGLERVALGGFGAGGVRRR